MLREIPTTTDLKIHVVASGDLAVCAAHAMLFNPDIRQATFSSPPVSHRKGPAMLHVLKIMDVPQVTGMAAALGNRKITVAVPEANDWVWAESLTRLANQGKLTIKPSGSKVD
jgi:hypothetical protein